LIWLTRLSKDVASPLAIDLFNRSTSSSFWSRAKLRPGLAERGLGLNRVNGPDLAEGNALIPKLSNDGGGGVDDGGVVGVDVIKRATAALKDLRGY